MSNIKISVNDDGSVSIKQNYCSIYELKRAIFIELAKETCKTLNVELTSHPYDIDVRDFLGDACFRHGFDNLKDRVKFTSFNKINEEKAEKIFEIFDSLRIYVEDGQYPTGQVKNFK